MRTTKRFHLSGFISSVLVTAVIGTGAVLASSPPASAASASYPGLTTSYVLTGMVQAVTAKFAPDGRIFVALKPGQVSVYAGPGDQHPVTALDIRNLVYDQGDRGLLGLALDPAFDTGRPYIYVLYSYDRDPFGSTTVPRWGTAAGADTCPANPGAAVDGCTSSAQLARYTIGAGGIADPASRLVLLDGAGAGGGWCAQFNSHSIGTVAFGPDGNLYVGAGDGGNFKAADYGQYGGTLGTITPANPCNDRPSPRGTALLATTSNGGALRAQAVRAAPATGYVSWDGAILRVNPNTGQAAAGNPLLNNGIAGDDRIVAYGLRNPFRFNFRPGSNELWLGDVGWNTFEEIDRFATGAGQTTVPNFGWPCYEGDGFAGTHREPEYAAANIGLCQSLYANNTSSLGGVSSPLTRPYLAWGRAGAQPAPGCVTLNSDSVTAGVFLNNPSWPAELQGSYIFGDFPRHCLVAMLAGADGQPDPTKLVTLSTTSSMVDIQTGPGGDVYYLDVAEGTLNRLRPTAANVAPTAVFSASPSSGPAPLSVTFDATASSDANLAEVLSYSWDLDGDGYCNDATGSTATRTYPTATQVAVSLCVADQLGAVGSTTRIIRATAPAPPAPTLSSVHVAPTTVAVGFFGSSTTVTATVNAPAGVGSVTGTLRAPNGTLRSVGLSRSSGTATSGTWGAAVALPNGGPSGVYTSSVTATDSLGRTVTAAAENVTVRQQSCYFVIFCF